MSYGNWLTYEWYWPKEKMSLKWCCYLINHQRYKRASTYHRSLFSTIFNLSFIITNISFVCSQNIESVFKFKFRGYNTSVLARRAYPQSHWIIKLNMKKGNCRLFGIYPFLQQIVMILSTLIQRDILSIANRAG